MTNKKFTIYHRICALVAFAVSAITYLLTIEPTTSFWDCGEFIAASYRLEVSHPPGNPMFQLIARFFTLFGDNMHAALLVNIMSALCSALTIFFLYLLIVWFAKRLVLPNGITSVATLPRNDKSASAPSSSQANNPQSDPSSLRAQRGNLGDYSTAKAIVIYASGLVGSLIYCFSDTFWFSAVEGEVYAMSSLFTAAVFWAMTMWYDRADEPYSNKWIVLIAFLMGLSIGVHLLNLLMIPALVYVFFYRKNDKIKKGNLIKIFLIGVVILAAILFIIIPWLPKFAGYFDLFFVNVLGLPYNSGAAFFILGVLGLCFWGLFASLRKNKVFLNTALMCLTTIIIGYSVFSVVIIRSCAKAPISEYQPDNAFTLVRYISREQYGKNPLIYGEYFDAPYELETPQYWAPLDGKYKKVDGPVQAKYNSEGKMLFPRMWSASPSGDGSYEEFYETYTNGKGKKLKGSDYRKPTMGANLAYFFDYQMNWMYWRYFMWNFAGRQNQIHSPTPGNIFHGNWECGIPFIDQARLGDQSSAPDSLANDKGKNHYYLLPLLLSLLGLFFQFDKDKRGTWLNFLMFFMTGIAIVIYLNQPPFQVRERDYAYAGSFYFFSVWCGLSVVALYSLLRKWIRKDSTLVSALCAVALVLVPVQMASQNWDDHDRSNRRTAAEMAYNYLNSVGENGILITHGDNDTFPLWYAQEVENVRPDVRIVNTSLLGTDWHIDQMKYAVNEAAPLPLTVPLEQYLYGTNEYIPISDTRNTVMDIKDLMNLFKNPKVKATMSSGRKVDYIASRKISIPVNKENVLRSGILDQKYADAIPDSIIFTISPNKDYLTKPELFLLDLLSNYEWDRPIYTLSMGGDLNIGIKEYFEYQGYNNYLFVPIKNKTTTSTPGFVDTDRLYHNMTEVYNFDALASDNYFIDYQNYYTHLGVNSIRTAFVTSAQTFYKKGESERALEMLDKCNEIMAHYPLEAIPVGFSGNDYMVIDMVTLYYKLGYAEKAREIAINLGVELLTTAQFYLDFYEWGAKEDFELAGNYIYYLHDELVANGDEEIAKNLLDSFMALMGVEEE